jgi:LysR family glycine cleavage system transcriptional activator
MRIPVPLAALRAFEAAARCRSIKDAASELAVTPSAVSHQLRVLEDALGVELLRRTSAGLELTESGRQLAPELHEGFHRIARAVNGVRQERLRGPLRLSVLPTFAIHWLSPRLARYPFDRPGFELEITSAQTVVDLAAGEADAAIRHGHGQWPGLVAERLFGESATLVGGAHFPSGDEAARAAVSRMPLFLAERRRAAFEAWNAALPGGPVAPGTVTLVDSVGIALRAVIDGAGTTLAGTEMIADDLAAGRLRAPFPHRLPIDVGYFLVYPEALRDDRRIGRFRDWLFEQLALPSRSA